MAVGIIIGIGLLIAIIVILVWVASWWTVVRPDEVHVVIQGRQEKTFSGRALN